RTCEKLSRKNANSNTKPAEAQSLLIKPCRQPREDEMSKLDASILSYDGKNFTRTETTLMEGGKSAVGTKLNPKGPGYKALMDRHSYTGPLTMFGKNYQANYAPLIGADGKVTGALFVGVAK